MQLTSLLTIGIAAIATALPTEAPQQSSANHIEARDWHWIGEVGQDGRAMANLYVNGGCVGNANFMANMAHYGDNIRCRFYRTYNCQSQIGGFEGMRGIGSGRWQRTSEWFGSATCWFA
ncbi:hypothetical protein B0J11DRAFT_574658 [Dendryphion nanum]|uniref:Uncharacterized protein n=1 Tax=Dendryphion nanum TaxID=256645 RepID=A0A9P9EKC9_9PLEO|nr:hypothetical protein B0J11DRAFT_574658 [Dendryphion nanum]